MKSLQFIIALSAAALIVPPADSLAIGGEAVREWTESGVKKGKVYARGKTKAEAYAEAAGKIPSGATPGKPSYIGSDRSGWGCWLEWSK